MFCVPVPPHPLPCPCCLLSMMWCLQEVRFQTKGGKVLNHGRLNEAGSITCHCKQCGGAKNISASEFEEHSGSKDRRPADGIYLEGAGEHACIRVGVGVGVAVASICMHACAGE